jgi:hypothetical protein
MVTMKGTNETVTRAALFLVLLAALGGMLVVMGRALEMVAQAPAQTAAQADAEAAIQQLPPLTDHAIVKHAEAVEIHTWLSTHDVRGCRWDCGDRTIYACRMDSGQWVFAVLDALNTITAYPVDQGYAVGHTRDDPHCRQWMNGAHP